MWPRTEDVVAMQNGAVRRRSGPTFRWDALVVLAGLGSGFAGGTAGLCQPVERDIYDCYVTCFWPAQVPDHLNNYPDWASKCASATKDWRNLDLVLSLQRWRFRSAR
jgi:hypothetical protein